MPKNPLAKVKPSDLWRLDGTIDKDSYLWLGIILVTIKFLLDRLISSYFFHRTWSIFEYVIPAQGLNLFTMPVSDMIFYGTMLTTSMPFAWTGSALTLRRLRALQLPEWLVVLFFVPAVNLILFKVLTVDPYDESSSKSIGYDPTGRIAQEQIAQEAKKLDLSGKESSFAKQHMPENIRKNAFPVVAKWQDKMNAIALRVIPKKTLPAAAFAIFAPIPFALLTTFLSLTILKTYGWGIFVALPFAVATISVILYGYQQPRSLRSCLGVGCACVLVLGISLFLVSIEGAACLLMALPLVMIMAIPGALLGYAIQDRRKAIPLGQASSLSTLLLISFSVPFLMGAEYLSQPEAPLQVVRSQVIVDAPSERVWQRVVSFPPLDKPQSWLFRTGIAYPCRADIYGKGKGAVRHCRFSTGDFVEPITVWQEPRQLKFDVSDQPIPMREFSLNRDLHPVHLDNYLRSRAGEFLLEPLPGGKTKLIGSTWYTNTMWPQAYWKVWSDFVIHEIHMRVLEHVKKLAEG